MDDVGDLLERVHRQIVDEPGSFERIARRRHRRQRRRRVVAGIVAIAVMAAAGVLLASLGGLRNERGPTPATTPNETQPPLTRPIIFEGLRTIEADGSGLARLPEGATPAWSPDGTQIAFLGLYHGSQPGLFVMRADGTSIRNVNRMPGEGQPAWSPDGTAIAFTALDADRSPQIFVIHPDGSGLAQLTHMRSPFGDGPGLAAWSPDGAELLFSSDQNIASDIYEMDADGSHVHNLTHAHSPDLGESAPQWSPDGSRILFVREDGYGRNDIYTMAPDGRDWRVLRANVGGWPHPRWSPDGGWMVFEDDRGSPQRLVVMDANGRNARTIFRGFWPNDPAWG